MKRVGILILAYEVVRTLIAAYERIPAPLKKEAAEIYILDDASTDNTFWAGMEYKLLHNIPNLNVYRNPRNLGYGGNQRKACVIPSTEGTTASWVSMETCKMRPNGSPTSFNRFWKVRGNWVSASG